MDTEKLYDRDAFLKEFDAVVTDCRPGKGDTYLVTLDRTAFYPEGGGQPADHGDLGGGAVGAARPASPHAAGQSG